jgi:hypothetical protein
VEAVEEVEGSWEVDVVLVVAVIRDLRMVCWRGG